MSNKPKRVYPNLKAFLDDLRRQGSTQEAFAARMEMSPGYLSDLKNGVQRPSLALAARLAHEAGVPIESFLTEADS